MDEKYSQNIGSTTQYMSCFAVNCYFITLDKWSVLDAGRVATADNYHVHMISVSVNWAYLIALISPKHSCQNKLRHTFSIDP